jgi:hypothetical protein
LAIHCGMRAAGVLNDDRPEGRSLASEEMAVSSRTLWGAGGGGGRVVRCRRRPVRGEVPGGGGRRRRLASRGGLQPSIASKELGRHGWRRSKAHEGDDTGGLRQRLGPMGKSRGRGVKVDTGALT